MSTITRFAPSPTGILHIGGARTALFNRLYARRTGGRFLLRIEDTDHARSTPEAVAAITDGLQALGLTWDGPVVFQSQNIERHRAAAEQLLAGGAAYRTYDTPEELEVMRRRAREGGERPVYRTEGSGPATVRLRLPTDDAVLHDLVQGEVRIPGHTLDDWVMLRADGTPTYMLAAVIDDIDAGVTHIIRGDDHLINAARQVPLFRALGASVPTYAHVPLIHGPDGHKLSKRHGDPGIESFLQQGYLPEALRNYLTLLGWSFPGDRDIFSDEEAAAVFDPAAIVRSPARLDADKLGHINAHYLRAEAAAGGDPVRIAFAERARTRTELAAATAFLQQRGRPEPVDEKARALNVDPEKGALRAALAAALRFGVDAAGYDAQIAAFLAERGVKMPALGPCVRAALTGRTDAPGLGLIIFALERAQGVDEVRARLC